MIDELSLLEADSIEAVEAFEPESAFKSLPAPDFTGSLDYIDSLANRSALAISRRDVANITAAVSSFDYLSPLLDTKAAPSSDEVAFNASTDFRPLQDGRVYDPQRFTKRPTALVRSSSEVIAPQGSRIRQSFPPGWVNPLDPDRDIGDLNRTMSEIERRISRKPFAFRKPNQVVICLKRKLRKQMIFASGFAGLSTKYFRKPRRNYWSRVIC